MKGKHVGAVVGGLIAFGAPTLAVLLGFPTTLAVVAFAAAVLIGSAYGLVTAHSRRAASPTRLLSVRLSNNLSEEIGTAFGTASLDIYVERECEESLRAAAITTTDPIVQILSADAGSGKTSILWNLHRQLTKLGHYPILVSAAWLSATTTQAALPKDTLIRDMRSLLDQRRRPIVLIDTVDLLLHNSNSRVLTLDLVAILQEMNLAVVLATRPSEEEVLPTSLGKVIQLDRYTPREVSVAVHALVRRFAPGEDAFIAEAEIQDAVARGLPVREVCEKPLFLRMLFELAQPNLPDLRETDVTSLYRQYWDDRIESDKRVGALSESENLSSHAAATALLMLSSGTPEVRSSSLLERAPHELIAIEPFSNRSYREGLMTLTERGVLVEEGQLVSFFHQTMFEFVAALAIRRRGRSGDLELLLRHVLDNPLDLFVGAVLEQYLLLSADDSLGRDSVAEVTKALIDSGATGLANHAIRTLARKPTLINLQPNVLDGLGHSQTEHLITLSASGSLPDYENLATLYRSVWKTGSRAVRKAITTALLRLAPRNIDWARQTSALLGVVVQATRDPETVQRLTELHILLYRKGRQSDADQIAMILRKLDDISRPTFIETLTHLGDRWAVIGDAVLLAAVRGAIGHNMANKKTDMDGLQRAYGHLLYHSAPLEDGQYWTTLAERVAQSIVEEPTSPDLAAYLHSLAEFLSTSNTAPTIHGILKAVRSAPPGSAPRLLARCFYGPLLEGKSLATIALTISLQDDLQGLPVAKRGLKSDHQHRANVARIALSHPNTNDSLIKDITSPLAIRDSTILRRADGLVAVLPHMYRAGVPGSREQIQDLLVHRDVDSRIARREFLNRADIYLADPYIAEYYVQISIEENDSGRLTHALRDPHAMAALENHKAALSELITDNLKSSALPQREGANTWLLAVRAGILKPDFDDVDSALIELSDLKARTHLVNLLRELSENNPDICSKVLSSLEREVRWVSNLSRDSNQRERDIYRDSVDNATAYVIASQPEVTDFDYTTLISLASRRRKVDSNVEVDLYRAVNRVIVKVAPAAPDIALERLLTAASSAAISDISGAQQKDIAAYLFSAQRSVMREVGRSSLRRLILSTETLPEPIAESFIRNCFSYRRTDSRPSFSELLKRANLHVGLAHLITTNLESATRRIGSGTFPKILA
ncbi:ATP-binding protein [Herbiconiux sp. CPCC 203386]|uniref:ATP-binding protein n=2 Tax=Herbiconiux daphne TaxID=2970914 RepID=A0ABT2H1F5_9MICO|nr:ATP-binding protein [Herbiconiux daphne]